MTVRDIVSEPLRIHRLYRGGQRGTRVDELLRTVGLSPEHGNRFPHEFSGGQRQRIGVARARAQSTVAHPRRAGVGSRRVDSRAGHQPPRVAPARVRSHVPVRRARPLARAARLRSSRRHVPRQGGRGGHPQAGVLHPTHPYARCSRPSPSRRRSSAASASGSFSEATSPAPPTRPPAADSGRGAGRRSRSAQRRNRCSSTEDTDTRAPVTSRRSSSRSSRSRPTLASPGVLRRALGARRVSLASAGALTSLVPPRRN